MEYKGFRIQVHISDDNFYAEIFRRNKLLQTIRDNSGETGTSFRSCAAAAQAAKEWIDRTYPKGRVKYFDEI